MTLKLLVFLFCFAVLTLGISFLPDKQFVTVFDFVATIARSIAGVVKEVIRASSVNDDRRGK